MRIDTKLPKAKNASEDHPDVADLVATLASVQPRGIPTADHPGPEGVKVCEFCETENKQTNNFCGNCGTDIRFTQVRMGPRDIIETLSERFGEPPVPLKFVFNNDQLYLAQILAIGIKGWTEFATPPQHHPWVIIGKQLVEYMKRIGYDEVSPRLFVLEEGEQNVSN